MIHKSLAKGKWQKMSTVEQLANIGSEYMRFCNLEGDDRNQAAKRLFELINMTIAATSHKSRLSELNRLREVIADIYSGEKKYNINPKDLDNYFINFAILARK